jgi:TonB family protein
LYSDYQKFGDKVFPHLVRCYDDGKPTLELRVLELDVANNFGPDLFARPDGALETENCQGFPKPPKAVYTPDPAPPRRETPKDPVVLLLKVGEDGKPREIKVARSVDKAFDSAAMDAVRRWRFEPAMCEGKPIETQINVEITFRVQ